MPLADSFPGSQFVLLALLGATTAFLLRRGYRRRTQIAGRDVAAELRSEARARSRGELGEITRLETRLYDFGREVEGRVETTFALLDRLIADAETEIARLETVLEASRQAPARRTTIRMPDVVGPAHRPLAPEDRRMIAHLAAAGYGVGEIAHLVGRSAAEVAAAIGGGHQADAA